MLSRDSASVADEYSLLESEAVGEATVEGSLLATLDRLRGIRLDDKLFSSPIFTSLADFAKPISPEPSGRNNPFAPLSASEMSVAPATSVDAPVLPRAVR